jgi:phospholipase C
MDNDPIQHVVALILENHSFDQMLGCLKEVYPNLDGIDLAHLHANLDDRGTSFRQAPTKERQMLLDPHHEVDHVRIQLDNNNSGFVRDFAISYPQSDTLARTYIMGYYPLDFLPALHSLGRAFTICDHWFSSLPGPTWPNRFFAVTGTASGRVKMPGDGTSGADLGGFLQQTQDTIFDRLTEKGIHWKVYFHDVPQTWVLSHQRMPHNAARYFYINEFFADARRAAEEFPQFSLIEPDFMGINENDDHPPHDVMKAEKLIADVYNALRSNEELWRSTLLVVFYDEHGGFYDHVPPPEAIPPDQHQEEYSFDRLGPRVPALLVSPWVRQRVESTTFDHTSLLRYVTEKWSLRPLPSLRIENAQSIGVALIDGSPREDTPIQIKLTAEQLRVPDLDREEAGSKMVSAHHTALSKLASYLPSALWEKTKVEADEAFPRVYSAMARLLEATKRAIERLLSRLYGHPTIASSIAEPDKIAVKTHFERDRVAEFLMHQKPRAMRGLAERILDPTKSEAERSHAIRTLASISGRQFHRHDVVHTRHWLTNALSLKDTYGHETTLPEPPPE